MQQTQEPAKDMDRLFTPREAAGQLAVTYERVLDLAKSGELGCVRIGKSVRFSGRQLAEFIAARASAAPLIPVVLPAADGSMTRTERNAWNGAPDRSPTTVLPAGMTVRDGVLRW